MKKIKKGYKVLGVAVTNLRIQGAFSSVFSVKRTRIERADRIRRTNG